jgi:ClpP class serine protease
MGSRKSQTIIYFNKEKTLVICGCFKDTLEKFEEKVKETYPDANNVHRKEYDNFIKKVKQYME